MTQSAFGRPVRRARVIRNYGASLRPETKTARIESGPS